MKKGMMIFCLIFLMSTKAHALCHGMRLQSVPSTSTFAGASGEYDVYDQTEYMQSVNFQVTVPITAVSCDYFITLGPGLSGNPSQRRMDRSASSLNYNAYTTASKTSILKDLSTATASQVIAGSFPALLSLGQTRNHSLHWTIPPGQVVAGGAARFQDTPLELKLYGGILLGIYAQVDVKTIVFQAKAESSVNLSLVNSGATFNIGDTSQIVDFGTLSGNAVLGFDTVVRSNSGYEIRVQSQKGQKLVHQNAPTVTSTVPYTLKMNGNTVDVSAGASVLAVTSSAVTPAIGAAVPTQIQIGTLTGTEAPGVYQDILNITVSAH